MVTVTLLVGVYCEASAATVDCRKAVRATLILIPLLGLQYVLFPMRPQRDSRLEYIHLLTIAAVTSLQVRC